MRIHPEAMPPLLRGLGTALILLVSAAVIVAERGAQRDAAARAAAVEVARIAEAAQPSPGADRADRADLAALVDELRLLRLQLARDELSDEVFENAWFQVLGLFGTGLIAASFLLEARRKARPPTGAGSADPGT
ncbi:hypothetical protein [Cognatilysobacter tabacisoli]|uniref:hypothetical protein n=1 Tax=Cognatilysobacter tabacisoli TaxID=2315424 RepID=UPI001300552E|nr:hypothetical protein [Lysobacter tabacisoli]